jgi:hypothetical protein
VTELAVSRGILDQPGTVAFLVIFGMAVILFFVFRSMAKHLRKINMAARAEAEAAAKAQAETGPQESYGAAPTANGWGLAGGPPAPGDPTSAGGTTGGQNNGR